MVQRHEGDPHRLNSMCSEPASILGNRLTIFGLTTSLPATTRRSGWSAPLLDAIPSILERKSYEDGQAHWMSRRYGPCRYPWPTPLVRRADSFLESDSSEGSRPTIDRHSPRRQLSR